MRLGVLSLAAVTLLAGLLAIAALPQKGPSQAQVSSIDLVATGLIAPEKREKLPDFEISDSIKLLHWRNFIGTENRVALVNFWATWCGPCIREMPSLDQLQAELGEQLQVIGLSQDRRGEELVRPFLAEHGLKHMDIYYDSQLKAGQALKLRGLPTTYLVDRQGRIAAVFEGEKDWLKPEVKAMIAALNAEK